MKNHFRLYCSAFLLFLRCDFSFANEVNVYADLARMLSFGNAALIGVVFHHVHSLNEKVLPHVL